MMLRKGRGKDRRKYPSRLIQLIKSAIRLRKQKIVEFISSFSLWV